MAWSVRVIFFGAGLLCDSVSACISKANEQNKTKGFSIGFYALLRVVMKAQKNFNSQNFVVGSIEILNFGTIMDVLRDDLKYL